MKFKVSWPFRFFIVVFCTFSILGCERHRSRSTVEEFELLQSTPLSSEEDLLAAFIQRDFEEVDSILEEGMNVDSLVLDGKTLLYLATESGDYEMIHFLVSRNANPDLILIVGNNSTSVRKLTTLLYTEEEQDIFEAIFSLELEKVSENLFLKMLQEIDPGSEFNLSWTETLLKASSLFSFLDEKSFPKLIVGRAYRAENFSETLELISDYLSQDQTDQWIAWTEDPFRNGRYRRAQCLFYESSDCADFSAFLLSCPERMRSRLQRAQGSIEPYLFTRNVLLGCVH